MSTFLLECVDLPLEVLLSLDIQSRALISPPPPPPSPTPPTGHQVLLTIANRFSIAFSFLLLLLLPVQFPKSPKGMGNSTKEAISLPPPSLLLLFKVIRRWQQQYSLVQCTLYKGIE